jgi:hypothetical protein
MASLRKTSGEGLDFLWCRKHLRGNWEDFAVKREADYLRGVSE